MESIFIILLCAHCVGDFAFQTDWIIRHKTRWQILLLHAGIHGTLGYLLLQIWDLWQLPVFLTAIHYLIDRVKLHFPPSPRAFVLDQLAHAASLLFLAGAVSEMELGQSFSAAGWNFIVLAGGGSAVVLGSGFFIGEIARNLMDHNSGLADKLSKGLTDGGKRIGQLERTLIFLLILINQPAGIGFLVAAKSVLRFKEAEDQALAEYILIGTLWSFSLAIAISWLTTRALITPVLP